MATGRIVQLDGLRAFAMLAVFLQHWIHVPLLWVGVDIFFVISGFLITGILMNRKRKKESFFGYFYWRRAFRILPAYILACLAYGIIFTWHNFYPWQAYVFFQMNLVPMFWRSRETALPLWSLAVEEQFYLVWPFLILFLREKVLLRVAFSACVVVPLLRVLATPYVSNGAIYFLTPYRADLLCAGAALAILWKNRTPHLEAALQRWAWVGTFGGFGMLAFLQIWTVFRIVSNTRASNGLDYSLSVLGSVSLLVWTLTDRGWLVRLLSFKPLRFIGRISYMMYLIHLMWLVPLEARVHSKPLVGLLAFAGTVLTAVISWYLVERPLLSFAATNGPGAR